MQQHTRASWTVNDTPIEWMRTRNVYGLRWCNEMECENGVWEGPMETVAERRWILHFVVWFFSVLHQFRERKALRCELFGRSVCNVHSNVAIAAGWQAHLQLLATIESLHNAHTHHMLYVGAGWRAAQVFILQGNKGDDKTTSTTCLIRFESPRSSNVCARFSMKHSTNFRACGREHITHAISVFSSIALYWISLRSSMTLLGVKL